MHSNVKPSGDYLADRRYHHAIGLAEEGDHAAAADLLVQTLERAPKWGAAWYALGEARAQLGQLEEAVAAYDNCRHFDREDAFGASMRIAMLNGGDVPAVAPPAFVRGLFDGYAHRFDEHLTETLEYRGPQLLRDAIDRACAALPREPAFARALDLGCGTGLAGVALDGLAASLVGVDLSPLMLSEAAKTGRYATLHAAEATAFLERAPGERFDLVAAADVLVYFGDLEPLFAAVARRLGRDGLFAFTVQAHGGEGYKLGEERR